ncbi:MAG: hypothetical protein ABS79_04700 [Planctomycetes bacterium SCN 63-9]|nr:MAG: hypothetical protein ABS79_04700 [Planctomycetes bacterium SCN 63-9]
MMDSARLMNVRLVKLGVARVAALLLCALSPAASFGADPPRLADYFGFQPIEIYKLDSRISSLLLKDLDGDKIDDVIVSNNARSQIDLLLSGKGPSASEAERPFRKDPNKIEFDRRMRLVSIPVNKAVVSIATGDFNGDGKLDIAYYGTPAEIEILFNEGDGRFGIPKKVNSGEGTESATALTVADLDQDGRDDLALLGDHELILVYQTATGILSEPERIPHTAMSPQILRAADIDGNHAADLIIMDGQSDDPIHIRFATEDRKLGPEHRFTVEQPQAIAFGQMDGKGGDEILIIEQATRRARILTLDTSEEKDPEKRGQLVSFALPQGNERGRSLAIGDLDGDKKADVVVTDPSNAQVWVFRQSGKTGLGAGQSFPGLNGGRSARLADLDGDGKVELYVVSEQEKQIGRSEWEQGRLTFPSPIPVDGDPILVEFADLDNDKKLELLYITRSQSGNSEKYTLGAMAREKSGAFKPFLWGGKTSSISLNGLTAPPPSVRAMDFNRDGNIDFMVFNSYGAPILLLGQKGDVPKPFAGSLGPLAGVGYPGLGSVDLGGQAILAAQNTYARRIELDSKNNWQIKDQFNAGRNSAQIVGAAALDVDGDGTKEVVLVDKASKSLIFLAAQNGVYRPRGSRKIGPLSSFEGLHVADLNGDGLDDLLIAGTDRFSVLLTGSKGERLKTIASYESKRNDARLGDLIAGDVNNDGCPDVVFTDIGEQSLEIATFAGDKDLIPALTFKVFERKTFFNSAGQIEPRDMAIGDVDGDRRNDLVLIVHDRVLIYRQDPGTPQTGLLQPKPTTESAKNESFGTIRPSR